MHAPHGVLTTALSHEVTALGLPLFLALKRHRNAIIGMALLAITTVSIQAQRVLSRVGIHLVMSLEPNSQFQSWIWTSAGVGKQTSAARQIIAARRMAYPPTDYRPVKRQRLSRWRIDPPRAFRSR